MAAGRVRLLARALPTREAVRLALVPDAEALLEPDERVPHHAFWREDPGATLADTGWDAAGFETCAHRFLHVGEAGRGAAVVNDPTYGHDVIRTVRDDGGTTTTMGLSLLCAPRFPDPATDQGVHRFRYALVPGAGIADAVRGGYRIGLPERRVTGGADVPPPVSVEGDAVAVEAVEPADDGGGDVVVRLYEAHGGRTRARVPAGFRRRPGHRDRPAGTAGGGHRSRAGTAPLPDRDPAAAAGVSRGRAAYAGSP